MRSVISFASNLGWGAFWTVIFLGVAYMALRFFSGVGGSTVVGQAARGVANWASPSGVSS